MGNGMVSEQVCEVHRTNTEKDLNRLEKDMDIMNEDIKGLIKISTQLTQIAEQQAKSFETMDKRMIALENTQSKTLAALELRFEIVEEAVNKKKSNPFENKYMDWIVKAFIAIMVLLAVTALGKSIPTEVWQIFK